METIGAVLIALVFLAIPPIPVVGVLYYYFRKMAPVREAAARNAAGSEGTAPHGTTLHGTTREATAH